MVVRLFVVMVAATSCDISGSRLTLHISSAGHALS